jgi:hypothetical protein
MQVDTGTFQAVMQQMVTLAARVEALEDADLAALGIVYGAGKDAARHELGLPSVHAAGTPRPRHLHTVRGDR